MSSTKKLFQNLRDRHGSPAASLAMTLPRDRTKINEPLALHTYIKLGGPADFFTVVKSADELAAAVEAAEKAGIQWFILGGGSNILVGDLGVRGLVIKNEAEGIWLDPRHHFFGTLGQEPSLTSSSPLGQSVGRVLSGSSSMTSKMVSSGQPDTPGYSYLIAESGVKMAKLAAFANRQGLGGLEVFMSVPGTLGGAIFNNSHYRPDKNEFIGNLVESAEIILIDDPRRHFFGTLGSGSSLTSSSPPGQRTGRVLSGSSSMTSKMAPSDHLNRKVKKVIVSRDWFRFRYDYSRLQDEKAVVLRVTFKLKRGDPEELRRKSLELMRERNSYQPIGSPSCGCMFKNPLRIEGSDPSFAPPTAGLQTAEGSDPFRVSAGKLIDEAGLKGVRVGGMRVSGTHANFMVNDGSGKVGDVLELMNRVKNRVKEFHGIELEPEIFFIGEFGHG